MQPRKHENTKGKYWVFFVSSWLRGCAFLIFVSFVSFVVAPQAQQPPTFRTGQTLIVQTVIVKDKDGKPVEGLTAKDFSITEDSEPQTITFQKGAVRVRQDFTSSRALLREVIQTLIYGDDADGDGIPDPLPGTAFGQDEGEFNIFNTDRQLSALQTAVTMLRPLPEQKSLIFFASGLRLNGTDNQAQLRATVNAAIRSNVTIHTIDARGLVATPPLGDATRPSQGTVAMF